MSRAFKITLAGKPSFVVFAENLSHAEKHAAALATDGITAECRPLTDAEYKTIDLKAEDVVRVPGGKADATATPFVMTFNGKTIARLATSQSNADKYLAQEVQKAVGFKVEALATEEYPTVDWSKVETLELNTNKKPEESPEVEGDAKNQTDISGIPGME